VKSGKKVKKVDSNRSGKGSDEIGDHNGNGDANADCDADKVIQPRNPTVRLAKKSKRMVEKLGHSVVETTKYIMCKILLLCTDR
jgi:hypothetical protein